MTQICFPELQLLPSSGSCDGKSFAMGHPSVKRQPLRYIRISSYHFFPRPNTSLLGHYVSRL